VLDRWLGLLRAAVERHGGVVESLPGGEAVAVFGAAAAHEDDALRAARAAVEAREAAAGLSRDSVAVRLGVETGEAVVGGETNAPVVGGVFAAARALARRAAPGDVLLGEASLALVRHAVSGEPGDAAFLIRSVVEDARPSVRAPEAPLRGRTDELASLVELFERAQADRRCQAVALVGDAGIGKTRLARELAAAAGCDVALGQCEPYGAGATYLPLVEVVVALAGGATLDAVAAVVSGEQDGELVARRVAELIGVGEGDGGGADIHWALRRFLEAAARRQPFVLVLDDVQWAAPGLLDFVEYLADWSREAPLLVLCLARHELLDVRAAWRSRRARVEQIVLTPLEDADARAVIEGLQGAAGVDDELRDRIVARAGGNPLYVEQLFAHAAEGHDVAALPPFLDALIASRLDLLEPEQRALLERAAVAGVDFTGEALAELSQAGDAARVPARLSELVDRRLVEVVGRDSFRFSHELVREAAYAATPKAARAELHERFAAWLDRRGEATDEIVGYHLEQSYLLRTESRPPDRHARQLAADAGARLADGGLRAWRRGDTWAATSLLERATALLPPEDARRRELVCELALVLRTAGSAERAEHVLDTLVDESTAARDRRMELRARIELGSLRLFTDSGDRTDELLDLAGEGIRIFEAVGDNRSLGRTWLLVGGIQGGMRCENAAWEESARRAAVHYRRSGWFPSTCLRQIAAALYHGPVPVEDALERYEGLLKEAEGDRAAEASIGVFRGGVEALRGGFDEARRLVRTARSVYEELGQPLVVADLCDWMAGEIALLDRDHTEAERVLRSCCATLADAGERVPLATHAAELAEALFAQGRLEEAEKWIRVSAQNAAAHDVSAQIAWRSVQAKVQADRGSPAEAEKLAREAVSFSEATDALNRRAGVLVDLAHVLRATGRSTEEAGCLREALRLYELKGSVVGAERTRELVGAA
jgi:tetratricopeptide (TPR) repeat protein